MIHIEARVLPEQQECQKQIDYLIFDADSTLFTIEGIDELAKWKGVAHLVTPMTKQAMDEGVSFETIFFRRLQLIQPTYDDLIALGWLYRQTVTPGVRAIIQELKNRHVPVFVVSGGYNPAVGIATRSLGIPDHHVFANRLTFRNGAYEGVNRSIPLWKDTGKEEVIAMLKHYYPGVYAMVGDGMSDLRVKQAGLVEKFFCFAGVVERHQVTKHADGVMRTMNELLKHL